MALNKPALQAALESFFAAPPVVMAGDVVNVTASRASCAQKWADAMQAYVAVVEDDVVIPAMTPPTTAVVTAGAALASALASAFALPSAASAVDAAFQAWALAIGGGMAPAFVATPPPAPPGFAAGLAVSSPTHAAAAATWATRIDTWMRTGLAVPVPPGPAVPWA